MKMFMILAAMLLTFSASAQTERDIKKAQEKKTEIKESQQQHLQATKTQEKQKGSMSQAASHQARREKVQEGEAAPKIEVSPSNVEPDGISTTSPGSGNTK